MIGTKIQKPVEDLDAYSQCAEWCNETQKAYIEDKGEYYEVVAIPEPTVEELQARIQKQLTDAVQHVLDSKAQELLYDNCLSVCSYIDTGVQKFDDESRAFRKWRSAVWSKGYEILDLVKSGEMAIPSEEELISMLPKLVIEYTEEM